MAVGVLEVAYDAQFGYELAGDPPPVEGKTFLARLGRAEKAAGRASPAASTSASRRCLEGVMGAVPGRCGGDGEKGAGPPAAPPRGRG